MNGVFGENACLGVSGSLLFLLADQVLEHPVGVERVQGDVSANRDLTEEAGLPVGPSRTAGADSQCTSGVVVVCQRAVEILVDVVEDVHGRHPFLEGDLVVLIA